MKKTLLFLSLFITGISSQAQINNGLVAKYYFNSGNANDEVGTNNLTQQNGASFGNDRFGNQNFAAFLDGSDDYLRTNNPFFYPGNDFTISIWYKSSNATQAKQTFFNTEPHEQLSVGYNWFGDGSYDFAINDGANWNICSNALNGLDTIFVSGVTSTNWNHFTITYDGTSWNSYINNNLVNTCNTGTPASTISDLFFGAISVGPQSYFTGLLDDIRIYNRAITANEVSLLFNEVNPASSSIDETASTQNIITIYPNPTTGKLFLSDNYTVSLTDITGKTIIEKSITNTIDISNQTTGIYFLIITNKQGQVIQRSKIVKE